jgi:hypothetical protein
LWSERGRFRDGEVRCAGFIARLGDEELQGWRRGRGAVFELQLEGAAAPGEIRAVIDPGVEVA